ncbi:unnamed protein product [Pipistrellus nathusii]|uniref:Uncharacterized protein n=1 Tax=Pipistrellus nathusii TaxID=59473 RepID=A0ABN9ZFG7_PIPNA
MGSAQVMAASGSRHGTPAGQSPHQHPPCVALESGSDFSSASWASKPVDPFGVLSPAFIHLCSLAVDTALLFLTWGGPAQLHGVLVLTDMLAGRQAQPWV